MNDPLPAGLVFLSCLTGQGTCVGPPPGEGGTVTARLGRLDVNAIATIEIVVRVVAPGASRLTNAATFTAPVADPTPISTSMFSTSVTGSTDLSATMTGPPAAALGDRVTYAVTVANAGPDDAPYVVLENPAPPYGAAFVSCQTSQGFCGFSPPTSVALGAIGARGVGDGDVRLRGARDRWARLEPRHRRPRRVRSESSTTTFPQTTQPA